MMHPSTEAILKFFHYEHLPAELRGTSKAFHDLAHSLVDLEGPEVTTGLRKLLEAKDCFVRAAAEAAGKVPS